MNNLYRLSAEEPNWTDWSYFAPLGSAAALEEPPRCPAPRPAPYLALLRPERGLQLPAGQEAVLQARQEGEEVTALGKVQRRPLSPVLTHQHQRPSAFCCKGGQGQSTPLHCSRRGLLLSPKFYL